MKNLALGIFLIFAANAQATDSKYYEIQSIKTELVATEQLMNLNGIVSSECDAKKLTVKPFATGGPLDDVDLALDQIINIGKKVWGIVESGKPIMNFKTDTATALPKGVQCWLDLDGWQAPQSQTYQVTASNAYGIDVVNFQYRVIYVYGGSVRGAGKYIGYATMQPVNVSVAWGFSLNAQGNVPTVFNNGTHAAPVGGMTMTMDYTIDSPLKTTRQSQAYFINGNGVFKQMN